MKRKQVDGLVFSTWVLFAASLLLYTASAVFWYRHIYLNDNRIFWSAIENALATTGVERTLDYSTDGTTQTQVTRFSFTPQIASHTVATYKVLEGQEVVSEAIAFPDSEYAVFRNLANPEIKALENTKGAWTTTGSGESVAGVLADNLTNGTLIFVGNLPKLKRQQLIDMMRGGKLYEVLSVTDTRDYDGKTARVYTVRLNPVTYDVVLINYFQMIGMPQFAEQVSANTSDSSTVIIEIAVDPVSRTIHEAGLPKVGEYGSHRFRTWGYSKEIRAPENALSSEEFQKLLEDG